VGENILIDDGKLIFKVIETNGTDTVKAETIQGVRYVLKKELTYQIQIFLYQL
jgi:pyruvate kinase